MRFYQLGNPLMHGRDLRPLQKALKGIGLYHGTLDDIFGTGMGHACEAAKFRLGYAKKACLPTGGQTLLDYLQGTKHLPPTYIARRRLRGFGISKNERLRTEIVKWARWGITNEPQIHYTMGSGRDDWLGRRAGSLPLFTDCSGFATACYKWAGAADPNGLGYRAVGFTGTLLDHGRTVPLWQARPGDLVIWLSRAEPAGHHVAVIIDVSNSKNPLLSSHGREGGPNAITLSAETAAQRRSFVVKSYIGI